MINFDLNDLEHSLLSVPVPEKTSFYTPVSHEKIMDLTATAVHRMGYSIDNRSYSTNGAGTQLIGYWRLGNTIQNTEMAPMIAFRNSYDKTMSVGYAIGTQVFICSNGCVRGDMLSVRRKHIGSIDTDLEELVSEVVCKVKSTYDEITHMADILKAKSIQKRLAAELLGRLYIEEKIISSTELNIIKRELEEPTFEVFAEENAWSLYNHCTHALKGAAPIFSFNKHLKVTEFFEREFIYG